MQTQSTESIRVTEAEMEEVFYRILIKRGFSEDNAKTCARIFMENSLDGVYTHGVNRFPRFVKYVSDGFVKPHNRPVCKHRAGSIEQWDGQSGPGPINALECTDRAMEIAKHHGMGCVALANTNHWMRGGTYGWKAAKAGFVFIGWTNTIANMPAWGATDSKLGNNPLVLAMPYEKEAIVLDMAMSQYSYGALELYGMKNEKLPVQGGYSSSGQLTDDPTMILESRRILPVGYWKGAGLSLLLDILATVLSGGLSVNAISKLPAEYNLSQVFIAIDILKLPNHNSIPALVKDIIEDYHSSTSDNKGKKITYPGEKVLRIRHENMTRGIPVLKKVWDEVLAL